MRFVVATDPGVVELNYLYLPTFLGYDGQLKKVLDKELSSELIGKPLTDELLDYVHERVIDFICEKYKAIEGLREYLDAVKYVAGPR